MYWTYSLCDWKCKFTSNWIDITTWGGLGPNKFEFINPLCVNMCTFTGGVWTGLKLLYWIILLKAKCYCLSTKILFEPVVLYFFFSSSLSSSHSSLASEVDDQLGLSGEGLGTAQHDSFSVPLDPQSSAHSQMQLKGSVLLAFKA